MFEEYLIDSNKFYEIASNAKISGNCDEARRYYRVSIMCAFNAIESFVNYIAKSYEEANNLDRLEICFLNDQELYYSTTKGVSSRIKYNPLDEKLKTIIKITNPNYNFEKSPFWGPLLDFKDFRDKLVHSREIDDETPLDEYQKKYNLGYKALIEIMNLISRNLYKKPLRKKLLDLIPE